MGLSYEIVLATTIALSLFLGKAIGVSLFSYISIKLNIATLPENTSFIQIIGVAILVRCGIYYVLVYWRTCICR